MSWVWRILPKKFRFQVSLLVVLMASLGIALFAWYMARQQGKLVTDTLEKTALVLSQNLAFDAANFLIKQDYASLEMVLKQYASLPDVTRVSISNEGKPLLTVTHEDNEIKTVYAAPAPTLEFLSQGQSQKIEYVSQEHELRIVQAVVAGPSRLGVVSLHYSLRSSLLVQEEVYKNTFSFGTLAVLLALLLLLIYLRKPIEAVQRASAFVAQLDLKQGQQLEPEYFAQEFETLSKSLNLVSQRLFEKEQDLQTSKLRLEAMLSHTVDGILNLDEELRISSANPAVERLFGYPARMLLGKSWTVLFPEAGIAWLDLEINKEYDKPIMAKHRAGFRFPVSFASSQIKVAGTRFYSLRIHDMTERYAYEKALREREAEARKLSLVASRTSNAVVLTDAEGRIEWVNAGFTRITEYALEEVKAKKPGDILQGPETCQETIKTISESLRQVKSARAELLNYSKSGRKYWVNLEIKPIFDEQGKLSNFMAIESDVTERRQAALELERALKAAEAANKAKSEFLSRMSHELRTPLNAILGFGQLLELEPLPESQRESVDHIVLAGHHLLELIDEILDISRIETGKMHLTQEPIALDLLLEEVMSLLKPMAQKKAVRFVVGSITGMTVTADAKRLKQVLLNLLNNAIKYNRQGGKVFIELTELEPSRLCLTIKDTGMGISEANLSRLFTPFDRLGADVLGIEGTGIGLVLSK
ncbi:MAG: PAS domain S-box protein, partial [Trueperaceae bacterium]|nr:PAS domain S-box protein [Trueperaceae bacterium]